MALNGSVRTNDYETRYYTVSWTADQSVGNNSSTVHWTLSCAGGQAYGGAGWYAERDLRVYVAGNLVVNKKDFVKRYAGNIASGSVVVNHAPDGTASFNINLETAVYVSSVNLRGSSDFRLNDIARASKPTFVDEQGYQSGIGTMGKTVTILMNRNSDAFTHSVRYTFGNMSGTIGENVTNNVSWTIPLDLATQVPNASSGIGTISVDTYNGSTKIGTNTCMFTCKVPETVVPTMTAANLSIDNSASSVVAGWGLCVVGFSRPKITASAFDKYGSPIRSYSIDGVYQAAQSDGSLSYTGGAFSTAGKKAFNVCATDGRGRTSKILSTLETEVVPYYNPHVSEFTVNRSPSDDSQVVVHANWDFASVKGKNNVTATLFYKKSAETGWKNYGSIANNANTTLNMEFAEESSYDFKLTVTDTLGRSTSQETAVPTADVLLDFREGGHGLGIGKIAETDSMEVFMEAKFMKNLVMTDVGTKGNNINLRDIENLVKGWIRSWVLTNAYPIGSIYINVSGTNPGNLLGGTWVQWGSGRVPVGVNTNDGNFNAVEKTGGQNEVTLTTEEIPPHAHKFWALQWNQEIGNTMLPEGQDVSGKQQATTDFSCGLPNGETKAHNNLQPYITCYMWKRTA